MSAKAKTAGTALYTVLSSDVVFFIALAVIIMLV